MNRTTLVQQTKTASFLPSAQGILQRKCACEATGEVCSRCAANKGKRPAPIPKRKSGLQRKLAIGASNDPLEQEADRVADQVMAASTHSVISGTPPRIQRYAGKTTEGANTAPASVDRVLASSGRPLELALRQDMGQRFGYDFSQVRVHSGTAAEQSAREVNANAYTVGHHIVFDSGRFAPGTHEGRRLIAHELTHVVQQSGSDGIRADQSNEKHGLPPVLFPARSVQLRRKGGTVGGFFANIGRAIVDLFTGSEPKYDDKTLDNYLQYLRTTKEIEDDFDSDNKARGVVFQKRFAGESITVKTLLVREMLSGYVSGDDRRGILELLGALTLTEREKIAEATSYETLYVEFDGKELDVLYTLLPKLSFFHPHEKKQHTEHTLAEYIMQWEQKQGRAMTPEERLVLARGCIGITSLNLGSLDSPDLTNCYGTFENAWNASRKMNDFLIVNFPGRRAIVFSKRFWSGGESYAPDEKTGRVDMSGYRYKPKPGFVNFDYGFYDESNGKWWHANHCDTPTLSAPDCGGAMKVYESNLPYYSRPLLDFDKQIFCVGVSILP